MGPVFAIALSVVASAAWGMSDFLAGLTSRRLPVLTVVATMQLLGLVTMALVLGIVRPPGPGIDAAAAAVAAGVAGMSGLVCFYRALATGTMSIVAPIAACGVALPVLVGLTQGDRLGPVQAIGLTLTVAGVVCASRSAPTTLLGPNAGSGSPRIRLGSIALALLAAVGFGSYFVFAHAGARGGVLWLVGLSHIAAVPLVIGLWAAGQRTLPVRRRDGLLLAGLGLLDLSATTLYGVATRDGALALVAVAGSLYPVVTVLMARAVLRERVLALQGVGIVAALGGVLLLAAG